MTVTPPRPQVETSTHARHPRVIEQAGDGIATVTILAPRNPFRLGHLSPVIFASIWLVVAPIFVLARTPVQVNSFFLAFLGCSIAWLAAELPDLIRGLHTRVELVVRPDELQATTRFAWAVRTATYRRDRVLGVRLIRTSWHTRALHVRFKDAEPLEVMAGYPDEQLEAAAAALRQALATIMPLAPVLHADDVATLPYASAGRSYEIEILRLTDGVSITIPPPPRNGMRALGQLIFAATWLGMFASFLNKGTWCSIGPGVFVMAGLWGFAAAVRTYLYRNEPVLIALTATELVIENGPWFRRTRRMPRNEIKSITVEADGAQRTFVLSIKAKRAIRLMGDREIDEIKSVADALNDAGYFQLQIANRKLQIPAPTPSSPPPHP